MTEASSLVPSFLQKSNSQIVINVLSAKVVLFFQYIEKTSEPAKYLYWRTKIRTQCHKM